KSQSSALASSVHVDLEGSPGEPRSPPDRSDNLGPIARPRDGDDTFGCLPYQLSMVLSAPTMVTTGNGEIRGKSGASSRGNSSSNSVY
uniref:Uncharacterized protein n=1 Tax=Xenopus tropicalis TaxID=8364 RepID=A0A803JDA6_XENTR